MAVAAAFAVAICIGRYLRHTIHQIDVDDGTIVSSIHHEAFAPARIQIETFEIGYFCLVLIIKFPSVRITEYICFYIHICNQRIAFQNS